MAKSPDAFRTISEVADWLGVQAHVLRFWESKFSQVKPIKRAGGRRYYRPSDMLLLGGIKKLLHDDGLTIKGAQKLLREKGNAFVSDLSQPLDDLTVAVIEGTAEDVTDKVQAARPEEKLAQGTEAQKEPAAEEPAAPEAKEAEVAEAPEAEAPEEPAPDSTLAASQDMDVDTDVDDVPVMPSFRAHARGEQTSQPTDLSDKSQEVPDASAEDVQDNSAEEEDSPGTAAPREKFEVTPPKPAPKESPKPKIIDVGPLPDLADFPEQPSVLSQVARIKRLSREDAAAIQPLVTRLTRLRASMASPRKDIGKD